MKVSIITPVSDRRAGTTLPHRHFPAMLQSVLENGCADFELLLGTDGPMPRVRQLFDELADPRVKLIEHVHTGTWGGPIRQSLMTHATGDVLWFLDDDDSASPGALEAIADAACWNPGKPLLLRMAQHQASDGAPVQEPPRLLWEREGDFGVGKLGSPCIAVPNVPRLLGEWTPVYTGDWDFIASTVAKFEAAGKPPAWIDRVVCDVRPWAVSAFSIRQWNRRPGSRQPSARSI